MSFISSVSRRLLLILTLTCYICRNGPVSALESCSQSCFDSCHKVCIAPAKECYQQGHKNNSRFSCEASQTCVQGCYYDNACLLSCDKTNRCSQYCDSSECTSTCKAGVDHCSQGFNSGVGRGTCSSKKCEQSCHADGCAANKLY